MTYKIKEIFLAGYFRVVQALSDPKHSDHKNIRKWIGREWHPEAFNKNTVKFGNHCIRWKRQTNTPPAVNIHSRFLFKLLI